MTTAGNPKRRRRGFLAVVALLLAFAASGAAWLASTGTSSLTISVPAGVSNNGGQTVSLTALSVSITRPNGNAQLLSGLALERVNIASGYGTDLSFDTQWIDPQDAGKVLNNPNALITIGFYYPIYTGSCSAGSNVVTVTDNSQTFCAQLDTGATGYPIDTGEVLLSTVQLGGRLQTSVSDSGATTGCPASSGSAWCLPSGVGNPAGTEIGYLIASIQTPGGKPQGQQSTLNTLQFYFATSRH